MGLPTIVYEKSWFSSGLQKPKSPILIISLCNKIFYGFISLWRIFNSSKTVIADKI